MQTSDLGTEIAMLFAAQCMGLPVLYIELGNEIYLIGELWPILYPSGFEYAEIANYWAEQIKGYFPDVKIAINCATNKQAAEDLRFQNWNTGILEFINET